VFRREALDRYVALEPLVADPAGVHQASLRDLLAGLSAAELRQAAAALAILAAAARRHAADLPPQGSSG
jgi:hypothetical protein